MSNYESVIESSRGWFYFDWRALVQYRDLLYLMVRREIVSKYKQTLLGPLWYIIQPLAISVVFVFVFSTSLKVPTRNIPPVLFYLSGLLLWNYLSMSLSSTSMSLISNAYLFKKVYFPRLIVPLSHSIAFLLTLMVQLSVFVATWAYFSVFPAHGSRFYLTGYLWLVPFAILQVTALSFGLGLWVASLTVRYRDFHHLLNFGLLLWMYATPITYPMELVPSKWWFAVSLNPLVPAIEIFRRAFLGQGMVSISHIAYSSLLTFLVLATGILLFNRVERTFIDRL